MPKRTGVADYYTLSFLSDSVAPVPLSQLEPTMNGTPIRLVIATIVVAAVGLTACGSSGVTAGTKAAPRSVKIEMRDIAFSPTSVDVQAGETVRFVFTNSGAATHDAFIGDKAAQAGHEMEMRQMAGMGDNGHDPMGEKGATTVKPGKSGEITYTFGASSPLLIGCHEEGHYAAGMQAIINMT